MTGAYGGTLAPAVNAAVRDVLDVRTRDHFFLYVHYMDVHDHKEAELSYAESVGRVDEGVGELLDELAGRDLLEDTLIVLTSDHGERLGERHPIPGMTQHYGDPSFDYLVRVPLVASQRVFPESGSPIRGQDLKDHLLTIAGGEPSLHQDIGASELFMSERHWQVLRDGRWKLMRARVVGQPLLFDLSTDPGETRDVAARHPGVVGRMSARLDEHTTRLAARVGGPGEISEVERRWLEALGYVE
jgi:arylsulfatase A-like enzyme